MDARAAKLALARKKLKDHQDKKNQDVQKCDIISSNDHGRDISISEPNPERSPDNQNDKDLFDSKQLLPTKHDLNTMLRQTDEFLANEYLIASKRNLELQILAKNKELENNLIATTEQYETQCQKVNTLQNELYKANINYNTAIEQLQIKDNSLEELNNSKRFVLEEKTNLQEQLEFTKTILMAKEAENDSLHSQLYNIQGQLDTAQLQLQQLTSGAHDSSNSCSQEVLRHENEILMHKVSSLEQQLKSQLKDYQQISSQYEQYVGDLNEQLKSMTQKNEDLNRELQNLSNRENALIEQISEMEIRLQNYSRAFNEKPAEVSKRDNHCDIEEFNKLKSQFEKNQELLQKVSSNYEELQKLYIESKEKIEEVTQSKEQLECKQNNEVSMVKLSADIISDKVAAQRATEQNKKLKIDLQGLEETVTKMTKDKLELTEKLTAEKYLNRELTIKLAEIDEKANNLHTTLKAKDEEMIRLQASFRELEKVYEEMKQTMDLKNHDECLNNNHNVTGVDECKNIENGKINNHFHNDTSENTPLIEYNHDTGLIPKGDAMLKLQDRFLKIMEEVADLSDEKHRLEHIIMQLQNETETICEYVALYQQQRSLLKKRDEERTAQIKIFQSECKRLQDQLDEMTGILKRFAEDKELSSYFQIQAKHEDLQKAMALLTDLKSSSILDPKRTLELNNYYPCSCCSGQLIDV